MPLRLLLIVLLTMAVSSIAVRVVSVASADIDPALRDAARPPSQALGIRDSGVTPIRWRRSQALGTPTAGRLRAGVRLPPAGYDFFTWDAAHDRRPNPSGRRWGTDRLVRTVLTVLRGHRRIHPRAPRVGIGDLSPRRGGPFAEGIHLSHQNGLDVDIYYPRKDRSPRPPVRLDHVDRALAQDLVDRCVAAGAQHIFVDERLGLRGPPAVVQHWPNHEDHLHVRFPGN